MECLGRSRERLAGTDVRKAVPGRWGALGVAPREGSRCDQFGYSAPKSDCIGCLRRFGHEPPRMAAQRRRLHQRFACAAGARGYRWGRYRRDLRCRKRYATPRVSGGRNGAAGMACVKSRPVLRCDSSDCRSGWRRYARNRGCKRQSPFRLSRYRHSGSGLPGNFALLRTCLPSDWRRGR